MKTPKVGQLWRCIYPSYDFMMLIIAVDDRYHEFDYYLCGSSYDKKGTRIKQNVTNAILRSYSLLEDVP